MKFQWPPYQTRSIQCAYTQILHGTRLQQECYPHDNFACCFKLIIDYVRLSEYSGAGAVRSTDLEVHEISIFLVSDFTRHGTSNTFNWQVMRQSPRKSFSFAKSCAPMFFSLDLPADPSKVNFFGPLLRNYTLQPPTVSSSI